MNSYSKTVSYTKYLFSITANSSKTAILQAFNIAVLLINIHLSKLNYIFEILIKVK